MKTKGFVTYHGRQYQVTPGTLHVLAKCKEDPTDTLLLYKLLREEGYSEAELARVAQVELFPPAEQLPLFAEEGSREPWRRRD
jgi:hypothetical protein